MIYRFLNFRSCGVLIWPFSTIGGCLCLVFVFMVYYSIYLLITVCFTYHSFIFWVRYDMLVIFLHAVSCSLYSLTVYWNGLYIQDSLSIFLSLSFGATISLCDAWVFACDFLCLFDAQDFFYNLYSAWMSEWWWLTFQTFHLGLLYFFFFLLHLLLVGDKYMNLSYQEECINYPVLSFCLLASIWYLVFVFTFPVSLILLVLPHFLAVIKKCRVWLLVYVRYLVFVQLEFHWDLTIDHLEIHTRVYVSNIRRG